MYAEFERLNEFVNDIAVTLSATDQTVDGKNIGNTPLVRIADALERIADALEFMREPAPQAA